MTQKKPVVFLTRKLPDSTETRMRELFDTRLNETDLPMSDAELRDVVKQADVLVPTVTDRIDADLIAAAGDQLKLIASFGTGVDHIDLAAARARGITVTNTPGVLTEDTADVALALMLAVPRRIAEGDKVARAGDWNGWSPTGMLGHRINGKRLGIIGMGRSDPPWRAVRGFRTQHPYHNRKPVHPETEAELEATYWESLDQMLSRVDIVSVNCPHTPATHRMLSRERLELMQPSAYLVNTSRGEVVDEEALADLLAKRHIAGAGLDVYADEPNITPSLMALSNVVLLPHIGSDLTIEGRLEMGDKVIINIQTFWDGHAPRDRVIEAML